jgi:hypothetical protein
VLVQVEIIMFKPLLLEILLELNLTGVLVILEQEQQEFLHQRHQQA